MSKRPTEKQVTKYVLRIAKKMKIGNQRIRVLYKPKRQLKTMGTCHYSYNNRAPVLRFGKEFAGAPREDQRNVVVHELLHLMCQGSDSLIGADLDNSGVLSRDAQSLLWESCKRESELMVDWVEDLLSPHMPKPPWGGTDG